MVFQLFVGCTFFFILKIKEKQAHTTLHKSNLIKETLVNSRTLVQRKAEFSHPTGKGKLLRTDQSQKGFFFYSIQDEKQKDKLYILISFVPGPIQSLVPNEFSLTTHFKTSNLLQVYQQLLMTTKLQMHLHESDSHRKLDRK